MTFIERWFEEVWNKGREDAIDEMMAPHMNGHGLKGPDGKEIDGMTAFRSFHKIFRSAFSDIHVIVEDTVTEGERQWLGAMSRGLTQEMGWAGLRRVSR